MRGTILKKFYHCAIYCPKKLLSFFVFSYYLVELGLNLSRHGGNVRLFDTVVDRRMLYLTIKQQKTTVERNAEIFFCFCNR